METRIEINLYSTELATLETWFRVRRIWPRFHFPFVIPKVLVIENGTKESDRNRNHMKNKWASRGEESPVWNLGFMYWEKGGKSWSDFFLRTSSCLRPIQLNLSYKISTSVFVNKKTVTCNRRWLVTEQREKVEGEFYLGEEIDGDIGEGSPTSSPQRIHFPVMHFRM